MVENAGSVLICEEDVVAASRAHYRLDIRRFRWIGVLLLVLLIAGIISNIFDERGFWFSFIDSWIIYLGVSVIMLQVVGNYYFFIPRSARRFLHQQVALRSRLDFHWDADSIVNENADHRSKMAWGDFHAYLATDNLLLLYLSDRMYWIMPDRGFPKPMRDDVVAHLQSAGVHARNVRKKRN